MFRALFQRLAIAVACVLLLTMSLPLTMAPQAALAQSSTVSINPTQGPVGSQVTGSGTNWTAGDQMQVTWDDGTVLANTTVQSDGTFTVNFNIPSSAGLGGHDIYFTDLSSRYFLVAVFTVTTNTLTVTVQKVWTADGSNNAKAVFAPGDAIRYMAQVTNPGSSTVTATFTFLATGPLQIFSWSGPGSVAPGTDGFYSPSTVPANAPAGTYTFTLTVTYNGQSSTNASQFTVKTTPSPFPTPTPTPTPTSTPTPTPNPSPTLALTPTPTPTLSPTLSSNPGQNSTPSPTSRPASNSLFELPVPQGLYIAVTQGNNMPPPDWDHYGLSAYAFDFALLTSADNFVVTAAQGGIVIGVDDSSTIRCDGLNHEAHTPNNSMFPGCWTHANYVLIANDDGRTAALYMHLLIHSAKVRVGYHVKQGQQLGLADTSGYALGKPHLHFQVEEVPSQDAQQQNPGWWFTQSVPVSFSNPEVLAQRSDGVPLTYDRFCLGNKTCSSTPSPTILPGGVWTDPSPKNGQVVSDLIHFAAQSYPTHSGDPAIAKVNFTVGSQGTWKIACTATHPVTGDTYACDANLGNLGVPSGQIQVSFDVYDQAGNVNLAPNGVHTLTYIPTPKPVPTPTQPLTLEVKPSSIDASNQNFCSNGKCEMTLSNPNSNTINIDWKATITIRAGAGTLLIGNVSPSSGTLAPGQVITVSFIISPSICGDITGSTITFTGGVSPVVVQLSGSFGPC